MPRQINPFLVDDLPPFSGFPRDALRFLRELRRNNEREWFLAHKRRYEESVRAPMEALLSSLAARLRPTLPDVAIDPKRSVYRIYRDVRFSADKSPYKTHIAAAFTFRGCDRKTDAAFYFHVSPDEAGIGGGLYMPSSDQLKALRTAIAADAAPLRRILAARSFRTLFGELEGESLARVPQGYDREHPAADLLKRRQFLAWTALKPAVACDASFLDLLARHVTAMAPLVRWLADHSG